LFSDFGADFFAEHNDVADTAILMLESHIDNTAVIGLAIKGRVYFDSALTKHLSNIEWDFNLGTINIRHFLDFRFEGNGLLHYFHLSFDAYQGMKISTALFLFERCFVKLDKFIHRHFLAQFSNEIIWDVIRVFKPDTAFTHIKPGGYLLGIFFHKPFF